VAKKTSSYYRVLANLIVYTKKNQTLCAPPKLIWFKNLMPKTISALPFFLEFVIVLLIGFGFFSYLSLEWLVYHFNSSPKNPSVVISNKDILGLLKIELLSFLVIAYFLWIRGWSIKSLDIKITLKLTFYGIALYIGACLCSVLIFSLFASILEPAILFKGHFLDYGEPDKISVLSYSLVNGFFEEILVTGYIIKSLIPRKGFWLAIQTSILVRLLYHLYMGPMAIILIFPMGILFAYTYARWGKLWPIISAHIVADLVGFTITVGYN
jgi:membrane protease YdiL (CAAX protease family)